MLQGCCRGVGAITACCQNRPKAIVGQGVGLLALQGQALGRLKTTRYRPASYEYPEAATRLTSSHPDSP